MKYPSFETLLKIHQQQIKQFGGDCGIRDRNLLESAFEEPLQTFGDQELHASIYDKAAALGYGIINNHPFVDGNKRTGSAAMILLLQIKNKKLNVRNARLIQQIKKVASGSISKEELAHWLEENTE